jgi:hypothetical protein
MQVVQKQRSLAIYHASGKLTIAESLLPNRTALRNCVLQLQIVFRVGCRRANPSIERTAPS